MNSFRTEIENPVVEKDIIELEKKITLFKEGKIDEEKFRSLRLARGVYGQRQPGVQMIRIKIPYGKLTPRQLRRIADISDEYSNGKLHITTRQDIQIHYVSLDDSPELWAKLEEDDITLREACGNTVRNVTASEKAGIDPSEPFDVSPYAHATFEYFLRNPICQEMGRKFKIAFSSSVKDSALAFLHDVGVLPKVKIVDGEEVRGFKVLIGGGLGAQPFIAEKAYDFLEEDQLIPFIEALLRVFDRYGERNRRMKARMKFLLQEIGLEKLMGLVEEERKSLNVQSFKVDTTSFENNIALPHENVETVEAPDTEEYRLWLKTNVFEQKQKGWFAVQAKLLLGNFDTDAARKLSALVEKYAGDDIRLTIRQGILLKYVREESLPALFLGLKSLGFANAGYDSVADVTACPGTDTCNLGISSSTGIAKEIEQLVESKYPDLVINQDIKIKISGCPNSCGQHGVASIGFHGSSVKNKSNGLILPALQVLLGGGVQGDGEGRIADKVIKIPSKRALTVLELLFKDYADHQNEDELYADYYVRQGKEYFYELMKPFADLSTLTPDEYIDWGREGEFKLHKAVGECAGVIIDLVQTLILETEEKLEWAEEAMKEQKWADSIYHSYAVFINAAKALLLDTKAKTNTQKKVMSTFDEFVMPNASFDFQGRTFEEQVLQINQFEPTEEFALRYFEEAKKFIKQVREYRATTVSN